MNRTLAVLIAALVAGAPELSAQRRAPAGPRLSGSSFVSARYVTGQTLTVVASQRFGPVMLVMGAKGKPTSNDWTPMVGPGTRLRVARGVGVTTMLVFTDAPGRRSLDLYALPSLRRGATRLDAIIMVRQPLDRGRPRELSINPIAASVAVAPRVQLGLGATINAAEGQPLRAGGGVLGQIELPGGTLTAELMARGEQLEKRFAYVIRF